MTTKKAPTRGGQGWKNGVDNLFSYVKAAVVKCVFVVAIVGRAGGAR